MSKKKKKYTDPIATPENEEGQNLYKIKKGAVDRLVNASSGKAPEVSDEEIAKYRGKRKFHIPDIVKVILLKWWFSGAICFFFYIGLGTVIGNQTDLLFVFGVALGALMDLLTNNVLKFIEPSERAYDKYMMVTVRKFWSLFINLLYGGAVLYVVIYLYNLINVVAIQITGIEDKIHVPVEPILFGILFMGVDMLLILIKNMFKKIIDDAKAKK